MMRRPAPPQALPLLLAAAGLLALAVPARAQWNPAAGQWGKSDPDHVRVMTWNVQDMLCTGNVKQDASFDDWTACTRIVATLRPDILVMQECGDNSGDGTSASLGLDTVTELQSVADLFLHGGFDATKGQAVTAYVQKWAPGYDLPHVFVSTSHDGFNRNVILSRWPFADLNGDGKSTYSDMPFLLPDKWAPGGTGGIRGFQFAEVDLPDATYAGDLVVGNSHLKAGSTTSDKNDRRAAAQNIGYFVDHWYNGAGLGVVDPNGKLSDAPAATATLGADDFLVLGGDYNEDEATNGQKGPVEWIARAELTGGTDGTDRDRTDMSWDAASDALTGATTTLSNAKFDYQVWQDSIGNQVRAVIFNSATVPAGFVPPELAGFAPSYSLASSVASDHKPVFADYELPGTACNDAVDLGFAKAGTGGIAPAFSVCGTLGTGDSADFLLADAKPLASAAIVIGVSQINAPFAGGVLVPSPTLVLSGFATDATGSILFPGVAGGGGPFDLYLQWIVFDPGATQGKAFSNGLKVSWLP